MSRPNPRRPGMALDLTRWNRAGLRRFDYVDGDAAVWLEELRLALHGLYLRGVPAAERTPEFWRDLFLRPEQDWPAPERMADLAAALAWARLAPARPPRAESRGQRKARLLEQYDAPANGDHAWEIARAFARAAHVLLGHADAYANEGYLRTATQWDNLRRLAAMVNYQPTPPASATTEVALVLDPAAGAQRIARGLAMKHTPASQAPLIFETLAEIEAHPDLNAARVAGWNLNGTPLPLSGAGGAAVSVVWLAGDKARLDPGDLVVVAAGAEGRAEAIAAVTRDVGRATVTLGGGVDLAASHAAARLWIAPEEIRPGLPQSGGGKAVARPSKPVAAAPGDLVLMTPAGGGTGFYAEVLSVQADGLVLDLGADLTGSYTISTMVPLAADASGFVTTGRGVGSVVFNGASGPQTVHYSASNPDTREQTPGEAHSNRMFRLAGARGGRGFLPDASAEKVTVDLLPPARKVLPGTGADAARTVTFEGKPPKLLAVGSWFVARSLDGAAGVALRVIGISAAPGRFDVLFDKPVGSAPERTEFHGPMTEGLRTAGHDRNPLPGASAGAATLQPMAAEARALVKPGRRMIVSRALADGGSQDVAATVTAVSATTAGGVTVSFAASGDVSAWASGDMAFRLNVVTAGHGESKGPRLLGSGDGERPRQSFRLPVKPISHIPFSAAEAGVAPDMDVAVDGIAWPWRDFTDPAAEGARAWSATLTEDGEMEVHFRRRLPTGTDNVTVLRHRVGAGAAGTGIAPFAFAEPMRKHPHVKAIHQPFAAAGGADREPPDSLRRAAPARLAANGRAVSLADFERLAAGHAAVWQARAQEVPGGGRVRDIRLTLVPANGGGPTPVLQDDLRPAILGRAVPGVRLSFAPFVPLYLRLGARVRADLTSHDAADVKAAAEAALLRAFALQSRSFGQPVYVAEILAALEAVPAVQTALVTLFDLGPDRDLTRPKPAGDPGPWPANVALRGDAVAAIFPARDQVAHLPAPGQPGPQGNAAVVVEGLA